MLSKCTQVPRAVPQAVAPQAVPELRTSFTGQARPKFLMTQLNRQQSMQRTRSVDPSHLGLYSGESEQKYLKARTDAVSSHFPNSMLLDDFVHRLEVALYGHGFSADNTIACLNLCRDEITNPLKNKLVQVFGNTFNVNGLGGVLTSGVLGMGAGLSHSPVDIESGKERYVFLSFPHIALSPYNDPGVLCRPGRPGKSSACGALLKALSDLKEEGVDSNCKTPGVHEPDNPEYSILKQRLARRLKANGINETGVKDLTIISLTQTAERVITADLEALISKAVDTSKADYAVIAGVQIHSWGKEQNDGTPNLEYVQPVSAYSVVGGERKSLNLSNIPTLTPRQQREVLQARGGNGAFAPEEGLNFSVQGLSGADYSDPNSLSSIRERADHYRSLLQQLK